MALFNYVGKNQAGATVKGEAEAENAIEVKNLLQEKGLIIISINEKKLVQKKSLFSIGTSQKIKIDDVVIFARQLSTMISSGIPIVTGLDILGEQIENKTFGDIVKKVKEAVESGTSFSEALSKYPKVFSSLLVSMVRAGEVSGKLDEIMDRAAVYLEKTSSLQKRIKSAMIYPSVVTGMAVLITLVLIIKVVPVFENIFSSFDATLPAPTQVLINVSNFLRSNFVLFAGIMGGLFALLARYVKTPAGAMQKDKLMLRLPVFGPLFKKVGVSKFSRTLSTLIKSGIPMLTAIDIVAKSSGNLAIEKVMEGVGKSVREGEGISIPLSKSDLFPPMVVRMISIGEKTGALETMLEKIADFYDEQVDIAVSSLTSMLEPLIIAFLGIVIGGIVICMFMPIFKLTTIIQM